MKISTEINLAMEILFMQIFFEKKYYLLLASSLCNVITDLPVRKIGRLKGLLCYTWLIIYAWVHIRTYV